MNSINEDLAQQYPELTERAKTKRASAIKLMCLQCMGGSRQEIRACSSSSCALHGVRPYKLPSLEQQ